MSRLEPGEKDPSTTVGAPFPPAETHDDGPPDRPRRDVPTADPSSDEPADDQEEEADAP